MASGRTAGFALALLLASCNLDSDGAGSAGGGNGGAEQDASSMTGGAAGWPIDGDDAAAEATPPDDAAAGTGGSAGTATDASADAPLGRVTDGLLLLYTFDEGSGDKVKDTSGAGAAFDLTIKDPGKVTWGAGSLSVDAETRIENSSDPKKVIDACKASAAVTLEVWVTPAQASQGSYARILSNSKDANARNFALMQMDATYGSRLRTKDNDTGTPELQTGSLVQAKLTHVALTRAPGGNARLWVDGAPAATGNQGGDFSTWNAGYGLIVANEFNHSRSWLGELHLIAVYCRSLSGAEVQQNFVAGP